LPHPTPMLLPDPCRAMPWPPDAAPTLNSVLPHNSPPYYATGPFFASATLKCRPPPSCFHSHPLLRGVNLGWPTVPSSSCMSRGAEEEQAWICQISLLVSPLALPLLLPLHRCHHPRHRERQCRLWPPPVSPCSGSPSQHLHLHNA